jgi:beta-glucosidase
LPQSLQDGLGGWQSSETSKAFANYAGTWLSVSATA